MEKRALKDLVRTLVKPAPTLGVDPTTISRWLNGTSQPSDGSLHQLAAYFEISAFLSFEPVP